jgi:hypothetical protein
MLYQEKSGNPVLSPQQNHGKVLSVKIVRERIRHPQRKKVLLFVTRTKFNFNLCKQQGCQIFRGANNQTGTNNPNYYKIHQITTKYTKLPQNILNYHKIYQMAVKIHQMSIKYTSIFHCKTLQKLPKFVFLATLLRHAFVVHMGNKTYNVCR